VNARDRAYFKERVSREMDADLPALALDTPALLARACRILAAEGHESGLAGQVTAAAGRPGAWWTLQFGFGFEEATRARMVLVDDDLRPLAGRKQGGARSARASKRPNPGVRFHVWIYRKRPDVRAVIHTHAPYASALAATGKPLEVAHMDSAMLYGTAHLPEWPGVPVADDEGRIISGALGDAKCILLANHGLLATGSSVEEAAYLAVFFERAARMQLRAMAAGGLKPVKPDLAREARDFLLQPSIVRGTFAYWARRTEQGR
jgi:L-fuculose-phosphate aldolase